MVYNLIQDKMFSPFGIKLSGKALTKNVGHIFLRVAIREFNIIKFRITERV